MGGKKKKSATIPTVQPAAAGNNVPAVGNGVADPATTGKKQKPTPAKSAVKDIKPKGPKTYSLTNTAQVDTGGVTDKSILKVVIQTDLEKKIIKLINDFRQENGDKGPISGRLTNKKLLDLYLALQKFKFKTEHIEEAMKSSVLYGGDLHSALDWLCLNLKDEELPAGFSQRMQEENHETKPKFQPAPQAPEPESPKEPKKEPAKYCFPSLWSCDLYDAKEMAATAKAKKDKGGQRTAQDRIRVIQQEMKPLESHPMFNTVIKVVDMPKIEEKKPPAPTEGKEELAFGLFEQAEKETPPPAEKSKYELIKCLFGQSEGRTPFQVVKTWSLVSTGIVSPRVRVQRLDDVLEVCPNILTEDGMQAQHLGATLAIYNLCKGQSSLCGYQIRMENKSSDSTRLLYCTTGVLLRKLQQDHMLSSLTHIIVDEVHERSVQSDFLLTILKDVVQKRSNLHLVMMSATVDCDKFAAYFNRCPIVNIPGRTFPVEVFHLEDIVEETGYVLEKDSEYSQKILEEEEEVNINFTQKGGKSMQHQEFIVKDTGSGWDLGPDLDHFSSRTRHALQYMNPNKINMELVLDLLDYLDKSPQFAVVDGAVLVFLPGLAHIQQLYDLLSTDKRFRGKDRYKLVALHSTLSSKDQAAAFTVPPTGVRKIVLSTNIAETGVTIPDVVFVIDTGKTKENKYHESSQMSSLVETFVSKASALQRQGRAGRVRDGFCFRLYPKFRFQAFMDYSIPEILRVPLEELCLHIMKCEYGSPEEFLCRALDAPQPQSVSNAVCLLRRIGACIPEGHALTPLGHHLATLPVNVKIGKMLIFGAILGCLDPIATIAAAISEKSPFATPMNQKDQANLAKAALAVANSDHLTIYNAYLGWKNIRSEGYRAEMAYCRKHFLNRTALITIEVLYFLTCVCVWFSHLICFNSEGPQAPLTPLGKPQICVLNAVLTAGLYDSVGRILYTPSVDVLDRVACSVETAQGKAQVHPSSVNRCLQTRGWLLFQEKVKYSKIYLRDTTLISPFPMLLFGGDIDVQHRERLISLDGWIHFQAPVRIGVIFKHLRKLIDSLLEKKLENPRMNLEDEKTIQLIIELIKMENVF
uniref:RNA helicase n=1 Tax=Oncorhynchus mykiss TaxID=8022 RepID=A0A8C7RR85_ONCMY